MTSDNSKPLSRMIDEIETLKKEWLTKPKDSRTLDNLSMELYEKIASYKSEENIHQLKFYVQSKIKLDCNVEASTSTIKEIANLIVTSMVSLTTFILSFVVSENAKLPLWTSIGFAVVGLLSFVGIVIMGAVIAKKHMGTYARDKSFYELCLLLLEEMPYNIKIIQEDNS